MSINYLRLNGSEVKWCEVKKFSEQYFIFMYWIVSIDVAHVQHSVSIIWMSGCQHLGSRIVDFTDSWVRGEYSAESLHIFLSLGRGHSGAAINCLHPFRIEYWRTKKYVPNVCYILLRYLEMISKLEAWILSPRADCSRRLWWPISLSARYQNPPTKIQLQIWGAVPLMGC